MAPGGASTSYSRNGLNQYTAIGAAVPHYDGNGSLTTDGAYSFAYDVENRLTAAAGSAALSNTYGSDPLGRRVVKTTGASAGTLWGAVSWGAFTWTAPGAAGTPHYFLQDGDNEIAEYDQTGAVVTRTVPGPAIDEAIATVNPAGTASYLHTDRQGSVIAVSDTSGNRVEGPYLYDSYGNCFIGTAPCGSTGTPWRYTGQRFDGDTGLYYYRARYYAADDKRGGRFLQTDPIGYESDLNLYDYTGNDPTNKSDPSGKDCCYGSDGYRNPQLEPITLDKIANIIDGVTILGIGVETIGSGGASALGPDEVEFGVERTLVAELRAGSNGEKAIAPARGMRNPAIRDFAKKGRQAHKEWDPGSGYDKELTLKNGKRPDAVNFKDRHVKELKPDNPRAIKKGQRQAENYRQQLEKQTGEKWTCSVETYCRK